MILSDVMDDLGLALGVIPDLRVHPYYADSINSPAAVVAWPDSYDFDKTFQRGSDGVVLPVTVLVGRHDARTSRDRLAQYVAGSGVYSIKKAIEQYEAGSFDSARVTDVEFGIVTTAGVSYLAATFNVQIVAPGDTE